MDLIDAICVKLSGWRIDADKELYDKLQEMGVAVETNDAELCDVICPSCLKEEKTPKKIQQIPLSRSASNCLVTTTYKRFTSTS